MSGTAVFQSNTLATPGAGIVVHTDDLGNGTIAQIIKIDVGPAGTQRLASYAAGTGLPVQGVGTFQALGTYQPLAGSVHVANTLPGTVQVLGSVQTVGTSQVLGTVVGGAGEAHLGEVGGNMLTIATEFTRPADTTAYTAGDVVSDSTSATTMQALANAARVSGGSGYITGIRVATDKKSITPRLRLHFYNTTGATLSVDNAAMQVKYADLSKRVATWDMPAMTTEQDSTNSTESYTQDFNVRIPYACSVTSLYYVLQALDAFTPASGEKFTVVVNVDRN